MGKQHNSFKKDIDLLSEAYTKMQKPKQEVVEENILGGLAGGLLANALLPGAGLGQLIGTAAGGYLGHKATEDNEGDKTGKESDRKILKKAEEDGTAGPELLGRAHAEINEHGSLSAETRTALARDVYAPWAQDDDPHAKDHNTEDGEEVVKENILGGLAGALLANAIVPGAGLGQLLGTAAGGYLGHKVSDEEVTEELFDWHGLFDQLHEELKVALPDVTKEDVAELFATHALGTWVEDDTFAVEDQESDYYPGGYEAHIDRMAADHGYTGADKGHPTD